jgi:hypothetical protein
VFCSLRMGGSLGFERSLETFNRGGLPENYL